MGTKFLLGGENYNTCIFDALFMHDRQMTYGVLVGYMSKCENVLLVENDLISNTIRSQLSYLEVMGHSVICPFH